MLSFKQSVITRGGNNIRVYYVYEKEMHGAYEANGQWHLARWKFDGEYIEPIRHERISPRTLDLVNEKES
jgi:hypothetical protein